MRHRNCAGVSLTELLVGSVLLGSSLAVVAELMSLCVVANTKLFRQFDAQRGATVALDRIKRDVRMAQEVRSTLSTDEVSEFGITKNLASTVLILRLPIPFLSKVNDSSSSSYDPAATIDPQSGFTVPGYYVVIYEVIKDAENPGEYKLVTSSRRMPRDDQYKALHPWFADNCSFHGNVDSQVIAKGIVGPTDPADTTGSAPKVFSFIAKNPSRGNRLDVLREQILYNQSVASGVSMVGVDLEVKRGTEGTDVQPVSGSDNILGMHTEVHLRNLKTLSGPYDSTLFEQQE
ncbi:hypothetical protein KF728_04690 [Candidatus Obscuribacterales bacterium]|nr:hypothetical protein [Candidatus Obscuribacterales bacterium]